MDLVPWLQPHPLFTHIGVDDIRVLAGICAPRQFALGTPIFVERVHGESLFIVCRGEVSLQAHKIKEAAVVAAPATFGEMSLLQPGPRRVTATARTDVALFEMTRRDLIALQQQRPAACLRFVQNLQDSLAKKTWDAAPALEAALDT
jgi:CRP-like cAMP-binding protein